VVADVGRPRMHWAKELGLLVAIALLVVWPVRTFLAQAYYIPSASMTPQLAVNDRVVVSKLAYDLHDPHRGDIVVFDAPPGLPAPPDRSSAPVRFIRHLFQPSTREYIKRVVALPGERVEAREGRILIDGKRLVEPYLPPGTRTLDFGARVVPARQLWVMGDNRSNSQDSRVFGPIRRSTVVGRAVVRVWPVRRMAFL
jgi:signal peptidase I